MRSDLFFGYPCFLPITGEIRHFWYAAAWPRIVPYETVPVGTSLTVVLTGTKSNDFLEPEQGTDRNMI